MKQQAERVQRRKPIESKEIGIKLQEILKIDGKIIVTKVRIGNRDCFTLSVSPLDIANMINYLEAIPGYIKNLHSPEMKTDRDFVKITLEGFFKFRLLVQLYLHGDVQKAAFQIADLIDKFEGAPIAYSEIQYITDLMKDYQWDAQLFMQLHQAALVDSYVRRIVQAHSILFMKDHAAEFRPRAALPVAIENNIPSRHEPLSFVVEVIAEDCLITAQKLGKLGKPVALLNMANQFYPGGGYAAGAGAQEEDLCRRTDLLKSLPPRYGNEATGFGEFTVLYSPDITVFRGCLEDGYCIYPKNERFKVNIISSAAYNIAKETSKSFKDQASVEYKTGMERKIRNQLCMACDTGNRNLVLSAFGCGAFGNDPAMVSQFYLNVLSEPEFVNAFDIVQFAIVPNPSVEENDNFTHFQKTFANQGLSHDELAAKPSAVVK
ncbi:MAG: TIGR02452 family protein [Pseudomonadota bacterium]|nr:TIGR02452 family protein [Pseudomonadota bacterium]